MMPQRSKSNSTLVFLFLAFIFKDITSHSIFNYVAKAFPLLNLIRVAWLCIKNIVIAELCETTVSLMVEITAGHSKIARAIATYKMVFGLIPSVHIPVKNIKRLYAKKGVLENTAIRIQWTDETGGLKESVTALKSMDQTILNSDFLPLLKHINPKIQFDLE